MANESRIGEDIAVIKNELANIKVIISRMETTQAKYCDKADMLDDERISMKTKLSNLTVFQTALTVVATAIATYLGTKK